MAIRKRRAAIGLLREGAIVIAGLERAAVERAFRLGGEVTSVALGLDGLVYLMTARLVSGTKKRITSRQTVVALGESARPLRGQTLHISGATLPDYPPPQASEPGTQPRCIPSFGLSPD